MSQVTLKTDQKTLLRMKDYYAGKLVKPVPYSLFTAKLNGLTITGYKSGKVLFQGNGSEAEASRWQTVPATSTTIKKPSRLTTDINAEQLPAGFSGLSVVGSDEVGNGSYFGSLIVCSVYAPKEQHAMLRDLGVRDSKNLTDQQIVKIAKRLEQEVVFSATKITPEKYNEIQPSMSQGKMKAILHNFTLLKLLEKMKPLEPEAILIDQFELPSTYKKHIASEANQVLKNVYFQTKAEGSHLAVAAASILARSYFLDSLQELSSQIGILLPSGAGSAVDNAAARVYRMHGMEGLRQTAKLHFANTQKAIKLAERK